MLLKLQFLICQSTDDLSIFSHQDDALIWSKWISLYYESQECFLEPSKGSYRFGVLEQELAAGHVGLHYGYMLHILNLIISYLEMTDLAYVDDIAAEKIPSFNHLLEQIQLCYVAMFDAALRTPFFEQKNSVLRVSCELIVAILHVFNQIWLEDKKNIIDAENKWVFPLIKTCEDYLKYHEKNEKYRNINKNKMSISESFRLESEVILSKNKSIIAQYVRQTEVPDFVVDMLMHYWAVKMSLVEHLDQINTQNRQYYWTFVTRLVRYFKCSEATSNHKNLNDEFEFLYQYYLQEMTDSSLTFNANTFIRNFKDIHLKKLESVSRMKLAKKTHSLTKPVVQSSTEISYAHLPQQVVSKPLDILKGSLFWYGSEGNSLPCEVLVCPQIAQGQKTYVLDFYNGQGLMYFSHDEMLHHFKTGQLEARFTFSQCYDAWHQKAALKKYRA